MRPEILKYILNIESVIQEIESIKTTSSNDFSIFQKDIVLQRAVERDLEIIGEALRKLFSYKPSIQITFAKKIIGIRNIIAHAYDSVDCELILSIIQKDIPILSNEIKLIRKNG
ncbi:MAG: DUF86 domain-containing protein [Crocinitomicaceae bacterium]|nr:DUF86 domain-containing protein [Crocinitomicaceae bacterium]